MFSEISFNQVWDTIENNKHCWLMFGSKDDAVTKQAIKRIEYMSELANITMFYLECSDEVIDTFCISKIPQYRLYERGNEVKCVIGKLDNNDIYE